MAEITTTINENRRVGVRKRKEYSLKTDMTPMVDLGFLLISFFVITTELSKPSAMDIAMPMKGPPMLLGDPDALTVLLDKDNIIYYYHGSWDEALPSNKIFKSSFALKDGIRKVIREKQKQLDIINKKEGRNGLMLLIKPGNEADYKAVIDMLDEALIHNIKKYVVIKPDPVEAGYLQSVKSR